MLRPPSRRRHAFALAGLAAGLGLAPGSLRAEDAPPGPEVLQRYEQILERAPLAGPAFDRLFAAWQKGAGLDQLDEHWAQLAAQPGDRGATYELLRGLLADRTGHEAAAAEYLAAATAARPDDFHGWLALGDSAAHAGKWADAVAAYQKGLATKVAGDDRLTLFRKLGQTQQRNLDVAGAMATWLQMVEQFPTDPFAVEEAGRAELEAGQFDVARKTFQKLVDLAEAGSMSRVQALMHLAEVDEHEGLTVTAVKDYEAILPLTAESSWLNRQLRAQIEQIYRRDGDIAGLVAYYQRWTRTNPKDVSALLLLSGALGELGRKPEALDVLRKAAALAPDRHEVRETLGQGLREAGQADEAVAVLTALTADDPTETRIWVELGEALWEKTQPVTAENRQAALDAWRHIAPADSKNVADLLTLAELCQQHQLTAEALAASQSALALAPDAPDIRAKTARLLLELQRPDEAWKTLEALVEGDRATGANYARLAALQLEFNRDEPAAAAIRRGLEIDPKNFELLSAEWNRLAQAKNWAGAAALFERRLAAAPDSEAVRQVETAQLLALTSAGQLDDTAARLLARLGGRPPLTEAELRLLARMLAQRHDPAVAGVFAEARRRFPTSSELGRLESDLLERQGNYDAAAVLLQQLAANDPAQKLVWLDAVVQVRQEQGNWEQALLAAGNLITAAPTSAQGYLRFADLALAAGKPDAAVAKLQEAIRLSDRPNDIRSRLARYFLESSQPAKARPLCDDGFAAAEEPAERLGWVRRMATAYFQDGRIDELIARFHQEQVTDDDPGRNASYLAAIYDQIEDREGTRRELTKALAARPRDTNLIQALVSMADKEYDRADVAHYQEMLVAVDPSEANVITLVAEYSAKSSPEDMWRVLEANRALVMKNPLPWKGLLPLFNNPALADKARALLAEAIRAQGKPAPAGRLALAQFQVEVGDLAGAETAFWAMLDGAPAATPAAAASQLGGGGLSRRVAQATAVNNEARLAVRAGLARKAGSAPAASGSTFRPNRRPPPVLSTPPPDATTARDRGLVYLAELATQQDAADGFLKQLQTRVETGHWPLADRLATYAIVQAREPLLLAIEEQAKSGHADQDLDGFCYAYCDQLRRLDLAPEFNTRIEAAEAGLRTRLGSAAVFRRDVLLKQALAAAPQTPAALARKQAAVDLYLKFADHQDAEELMNVIRLSAGKGDWPGVRSAVAALQNVAGLRGNPALRQPLDDLPLALLTAMPPGGDTPSDLSALILAVMRAGYPVAPPGPALPDANQHSNQVNVSVQIWFPFDNPVRYWTFAEAKQLQQLHSQLRSHQLLPAMYAAIEAEAKSLGDWRTTYPRLLESFFLWWDGRTDDAENVLRRLLAENPNDDLRHMLAAVLVRTEKYAEAIPVLLGVTARFGPEYVGTQTLLLDTAIKAKDLETARKAGVQLQALHLPQQQSSRLVDDLRLVGLTNKEEKSSQELINEGNSGLRANRTAAGQPVNVDQQLQRSLTEAVTAKDETKAVELARQILDRDVQLIYTTNMGRSLRSAAFYALKTFARLDDYLGELTKQADANPDSLQPNWQAADSLGWQIEPDRYSGMLITPPTSTAEERTQTLEHIARALVYYNRVAELSPGNLNVFWRIFELNGLAGQIDPAAVLTPTYSQTIIFYTTSSRSSSYATRSFTTTTPAATAAIATAYLRLFKAEPLTAIKAAGQGLAPMFEGKSLEALVQAVEAWTPAPSNSGSGGTDPFPLVAQLGSELGKNHHPAEAARVYRKAFTVPTSQPKEGALVSLVQTLVADNRRDDAVAALESWFADDAPARSSSPLGFDRPATGATRRDFFVRPAHDSISLTPPPALQDLTFAADLGVITPRLRQLMSSPDKQPEAARMLGIYLAAHARDPAYRADLEKWFKESASEAGTFGNRPSFLVLLGQELLHWPEERSAAMDVLSKAYAELAGGDTDLRHIIGLQVAALAETAGNPAATRTVLTDLSADAQLMMDQGDYDVLQKTFLHLLSAGMVKEAAELLAVVRTDYAIGRFGDMLVWMQAQLDFAGGNVASAALNYGLDDHGGHAGDPVDFVWELQPSYITTDRSNPGQSDQKKAATAQPIVYGNGGGLTSIGSARTGVPQWKGTGPVLPTRHRIEIEASRDESHFETVLSLANAATRGRASIVIPPGTRVLRARLVPPVPADANPVPPPCPEALFLGQGDNLLSSLAPALADQTLGNPVATWTGVQPAFFKVEQGGPLVGVSQAILRRSTPFVDRPEISSPRIPIQATGTGYLFSGWFSAREFESAKTANYGYNSNWRRIQFEIRFLDQEGKLIGAPRSGPEGSNVPMNYDDTWSLILYRLLPAQPVAAPRPPGSPPAESDAGPPKPAPYGTIAREITVSQRQPDGTVKPTVTSRVSDAPDVIRIPPKAAFVQIVFPDSNASQDPRGPQTTPLPTIPAPALHLAGLALRKFPLPDATEPVLPAAPTTP